MTTCLGTFDAAAGRRWRAAARRLKGQHASMHDHDQQTGSEKPPNKPRRRPLPHELRLSMFGRSVTLPENQLLRMGLGVLLCLGGLLWFLPVVGIWMLPLGSMVLSVDIPFVRRHSRRVAVWFRRRYPQTAEKVFPRSRRR